VNKTFLNQNQARTGNITAKPKQPSSESELEFNAKFGGGGGMHFRGWKEQSFFCCWGQITNSDFHVLFPCSLNISVWMYHRTSWIYSPVILTRTTQNSWKWYTYSGIIYRCCLHLFCKPNTLTANANLIWFPAIQKNDSESSRLETTDTHIRATTEILWSEDDC
jgi:hypothetical protein